jgi:hypothetical protein
MLSILKFWLAGGENGYAECRSALQPGGENRGWKPLPLMANQQYRGILGRRLPADNRRA